MPNPPASGLPNPARYDTSRTDVVIDEVTGLMWQRGASPPNETYYELVGEGVPEVDYTPAEIYCSDLEIGGHDDWRLPRRIELASLIDYTRVNPAIDEQVFPATQGIFCVSSEGPDWSINFDDGAHQSIGQRVRCVRTHVEKEIRAQRYVFNGQAPLETVTDMGTGLVWQRQASAATYTFSEAQTYCAALELDGEGWRVPSMKELQTLVDEGQAAAPFIDQNVFAGPEAEPPVASFWTSTFNAESPANNAWYVAFGAGHARNESPPPTANINNNYYVRCVR